MVSSSAASSEPSCKVTRCGRKNSSAARSTQRIVDAVERVAQDHVHELVDEQRRHSRCRRAHDGDDRPLRASDERSRRSRKAIINCQFSRASASAIAAISAALTVRRGSASSAACSVRSDRAGFRRRRELRPRQIDLEEFVGDHEPAALGRGRADGGRRRARNRSFAFRCSAMPIRSTASAGSSSPSTSRNENARAGFAPPRGRKVRNVSRTSPLSNVRCTAISVSGGWLQSDSANATSSSAAARAAPRSGAPKCATSCCGKHVDQRRRDRLRSPRRSAPASTSRATATPRKPLRNAERALPCSARGSRFQNTNAPDTAHSPGSAAGSNTNVSDGSSRMVRSSFMRAALSSADRSQIGRGERRQQVAARDSTLPTRRISRSPFSSMSRRSPVSRGSRFEIVLARPRQSRLLPGIDVHHEMPREAFDQLTGAEVRRSPPPRAP